MSRATSDTVKKRTFASEGERGGSARELLVAVDAGLSAERDGERGTDMAHLRALSQTALRTTPDLLAIFSPAPRSAEVHKQQ